MTPKEMLRKANEYIKAYEALKKRNEKLEEMLREAKKLLVCYEPCFDRTGRALHSLCEGCELEKKIDNLLKEGE